MRTLVSGAQIHSPQYSDIRQVPCGTDCPSIYFVYSLSDLDQVYKHTSCEFWRQYDLWFSTTELLLGNRVLRHSRVQLLYTLRSFSDSQPLQIPSFSALEM